MMKNRVFIDSNIWIYLFLSSDKDKYECVNELLKKCFQEDLIVISFQVLNEVTFNLKKKGCFAEEKVRNIIHALESNCIIIDFSLDILLRASEIRERYQYSFWDSLIVASAISANCKILYSEDLQHGREIEGLLTKNPLKF
jgi:predicted nucleic acid-binding protein